MCNYRLFTKYREIFPPVVVGRLVPELARALVRPTTKGGNISRYLVNNLFIIRPTFVNEKDVSLMLIFYSTMSLLYKTFEIFKDNNSA